MADLAGSDRVTASACWQLRMSAGRTTTDYTGSCLSLLLPGTQIDGLSSATLNPLLPIWKRLEVWVPGIFERKIDPNYNLPGSPAPDTECRLAPHTSLFQRLSVKVNYNKGVNKDKVFFFVVHPWIYISAFFSCGFWRRVLFKQRNSHWGRSWVIIVLTNWKFEERRRSTNDGNSIQSETIREGGT